MTSGQVVFVPLDVADAIGVGHSLRALVQNGKLPAETADTYIRVGEQLVSAARAEMATTRALIGVEPLPRERGRGGVL